MATKIKIKCSSKSVSVSPKTASGWWVLGVKMLVIREIVAILSLILLSIFQQSAGQSTPPAQEISSFFMGLDAAYYVFSKELF